MRVAYKISFIFFIFFIFYSCSPTKYVGKDEYLLDRVKVKVDDYKLNRSDLKRNIRQKPNTRILGVEVYIIVLLIDVATYRGGSRYL